MYNLLISLKHWIKVVGRKVFCSGFCWSQPRGRASLGDTAEGLSSNHWKWNIVQN